MIRKRGFVLLLENISSINGQAYEPTLVVNKAFDTLKVVAGHGRPVGGILAI